MGKSKTQELKTRRESMSVAYERQPQYVIKQPKFYCPLSPLVLWHHGCSYKECPIGPDHRDMISCEKCKCKGDSKVSTKSSKRRRPRRKKDILKVERKSKGPTPKIGKTYVSK
jgi:hypothetical protein